MMSEEEFKNYLANNLNLKDFSGTTKFKSMGRALRRGHITPYGTIIPNRPFNCRKSTVGRKFNELKKEVYGELRRAKN